MIRKYFQNRVKVVNGIIPTHQKMNVHDSNHTPMCPRCRSKIEMWQHVLKCKHNRKNNKKFLMRLKTNLTNISDYQV